MSNDKIRGLIAKAIEYLSSHPDEARYIDPPATAVLKKACDAGSKAQKGASPLPTCRGASVVQARPQVPDGSPEPRRRTVTPRLSRCGLPRRGSSFECWR